MTILLMDDEVFSLELMSRKLIQEGHSVLKAFSVREAKERCMDAGRIHVVIADLHLPDEDGLQLLRWMRDEHPEVCRILLSAHTYEKELAEELSSGLILHALRKPVDMDGILIPLLGELERTFPE